jgi:formate hydrogenlyase subunit 6/NADH:ubiquinone oxidoreductase subunit I
MRAGYFLPELLRNFIKKPFTVKYPFEKTEVPKDFRGNVRYRPETCTGCNLCVRDCPAEAIEIVRISETERKFKMVLYNDRCIHCGQCADSCNKDSIYLDTVYEIAGDDRRKMRIEYQ